LKDNFEVLKGIEIKEEKKEEKKKRKDHQRQIRGSLATCTALSWRGCQDDSNTAVKDGI
jgi:hypothetical protein